MSGARRMTVDGGDRPTGRCAAKRDFLVLDSRHPHSTFDRTGIVTGTATQQEGGIMKGSEQRKRDRAQDTRVLERGGARDVRGLVDEVLRETISRRQFVYRCLGLGLSASATATLVAACGGDKKSSSAASGAPVTYATDKPSAVRYYGWSDCMDTETPKLFEQQTGVKLLVSQFDDNETLLAKLKAGATGWDVITPSDYMVHVMIMTGIVLPLQMSLLPNFTNVLPKFVQPPYDPETDGKKYSTPWMWGTTGVAHRTDKIPGPVTSWSILWDPQYKGQINMLNDERETMSAGLLYKGHSINTTVQSELDEATQALVDQKPLVRQYDSLNCRRNMIMGVPLMEAWNGDVLTAYQEVGDKIAFVLPDEGYPLWSDGVMIPQGAPSPYGAHLFMDFMLVPENAARVVTFAGYNIPLKGINDFLDETFVKFYPTDAELERAQLYNDLGQFGRAYTDAWSTVKSS
jgi:spermidine/putrescine-binding protein